MNPADPPNTQNKVLVESGALGVLFVILAIIANLILGQVSNARSTEFIIIFLVFLLFTLGLLFLLVTLPLPSKIDALEKRFHQEMMRIAGVKNADFLWTLKDVVDYEARITTKEVWLVLSRGDYNLQGGPFYEVVAQNLARGIRYVFFLPQTYIGRGDAEQLRGAFNHSPQLTFVFFDVEEFFFVSGTLDIAIYNPLNIDREPQIALIGIPSPNPDHYYAQVSGEFVSSLVGKLVRVKSKEDAA